MYNKKFIIWFFVPIIIFILVMQSVFATSDHCKNLTTYNFFTKTASHPICYHHWIEEIIKSKGEKFKGAILKFSHPEAEFEFVKLLGHGGDNLVVEVRHKDLDEKVALRISKEPCDLPSSYMHETLNDYMKARSNLSVQTSIITPKVYWNLLRYGTNYLGEYEFIPVEKIKRVKSFNSWTKQIHESGETLDDSIEGNALKQMILDNYEVIQIRDLLNNDNLVWNGKAWVALDFSTEIIRFSFSDSENESESSESISEHLASSHQDKIDPDGVLEGIIRERRSIEIERRRSKNLERQKILEKNKYNTIVIESKLKKSKRPNKAKKKKLHKNIWRKLKKSIKGK